MLPSQLPKTSLFPRTPTPARRRVPTKSPKHIVGAGDETHEEALHHLCEQSSRFQALLGYFLQALLVFGPYLGNAGHFNSRWLSCILAIGEPPAAAQLCPIEQPQP